MTTETTWQRRLARDKARREYQRKESQRRAKIHPLRVAVNKALQAAKIPHSKTHYSSRVKGWPISTSEGWETESIYWDDLQYIRVSVCVYHSSFSKSDDKRLAELHAMIITALSGFVYEVDESKYGGKTYKVFSTK